MKHLAPLLLIFVVGCALVPVTPETARERYLAAEVSYGAALTTVSNMIDAGTITPGSTTAKRVSIAVRAARGGLDGWGARVDAPDAEIAAMGALRTLESILRDLQ